MEHSLKWKLFCCIGVRCFEVNLCIAKEQFSIYLALVGQQHINLSQGGMKRGENTYLTPDPFSGSQAFYFLANLPNLQCTVAPSIPARQQVLSTLPRAAPGC